MWPVLRFVWASNYLLSFPFLKEPENYKKVKKQDYDEIDNENKKIQRYQHKYTNKNPKLRKNRKRKPILIIAMSNTVQEPMLLWDVTEDLAALNWCISTKNSKKLNGNHKNIVQGLVSARQQVATWAKSKLCKIITFEPLSSLNDRLSREAIGLLGTFKVAGDAIFIPFSAISMEPLTVAIQNQVRSEYSIKDTRENVKMSQSCGMHGRHLVP